MLSLTRVPLRAGWLLAVLAAALLLGRAYEAASARPPAVTVRAAAPPQAALDPSDASTVTRGLRPAAAEITPPIEADVPSISAGPPPAPAVRVAPLNPAPWGRAPGLRQGAPPPPRTGALAVLVLDEASATVLHEVDSHRQLASASLTKIAAAVVALRAGGLDEQVVSDVDGFMMRGSTTMGLYSGDRLSRRDLLYGLMLPSGNDAALVLGRSVAGSDEAFVARMNALAAELGLRDTSFATPHGLGRVGYSSAYDLAILARHAMQLPEFANIVQTEHWGVTGSRRYNVHNVNPFLFNFAGADGVKTGFTNSAGRTLVASATRDGHRLYAVVLNDPATTTDAMALLEWAFRNHSWDATVEAHAPDAVSAARASATGAP